MKLKDNHIYVGNEDKLVLWLENRDGNQKIEDDYELNEEEHKRVVSKVKELIKN